MTNAELNRLKKEYQKQGYYLHYSAHHKSWALSCIHSWKGRLFKDKEAFTNVEETILELEDQYRQSISDYQHSKNMEKS